MSSALDPIDSIDVAVLGELRETLSRTDPTPGGLTDRLKFALTVHSLHAEVAELTDRSLVVTREGGPAQADSVTFTAGSLSLMISPFTRPDGLTLRVDGWVTRGGATVEVLAGDEKLAATADAHGRFVLEPVPRGLLQFIIHPGHDERPIITPPLSM